ncbi:uncharacterized protein LOC129744261 isoform X2 [Uranotaenia lowii]|uniref:uncharacterized protein LOC129744261 isoform X2 n=1 Tax=Uranotaenia lowii TaxID=190385 RepID=UPI00247A993A|nr:uncharacterized protein LOC129744261 isoform X2 [Uranotaenia lowii]
MDNNVVQMQNQETVTNESDNVPSPRKQKRLGPAPIASMEETVTEDRNRMDGSAGQSHKSRWYNAKECESPKKQSPPNTIGSTSALAPTTPRIDISRASSHSSHHDSRDSSPENVFEQDSGVLGYREEGTMDLRSSTEELQFMEPEKGRTEREKPQAPRYSPNLFKFEEQHQFALHHQRKDSASSEVASFLCISGRTSRISSVGSQGSANSKLSAVSGVSGISRSPSPHRMLLETSFCGPKPLQGITDGSIPSSIEPSTARMLEQVILSRKKDPTEAVLAEGINVDTSFTSNALPKSNNIQEAELMRRKSDSNANTSRKEEMIQLPPQTSRSISNKRYIPPTDLSKPIVGMMPSGIEYIRINLKPDHCYSDNGIADNERIIEDDQRKPNSLNLREGSSSRKADPSVSPKPSRHKPNRENGSRSPSPANTLFSRKSSFCSIFKLKDSASPDSPGTGHIRKKSGSNTSYGEYQERSRSKSKERDPTSLNTTPSKQKSVLAIFKPKKNGTKSKSPSPIDSGPRGSLSNVEFKFKSDTQSVVSNPRPNLRYYDTPLDGTSIHIPLHTPPEEKHLKGMLTTSAPATASAPSSMAMMSLNAEPDVSHGRVSPSTQSMKLNNNCTVTIHPRPKPMPPLKCYRIENPDGSITIPLKSPTEEKERDSIWSLEVQRNSSQESQDTVISAAVQQTSSNTLIVNTKNALPALNMQNGATQPLPDEAETAPHPSIPSDIVNSDETKQAAAIATMTAKERKQLLFSMKMGSGSQDQVFTTQFSVSKTESQCSQLSEMVSNEAVIKTETSEQIENAPNEISPPIIYRNKQIENVKRRSPKERNSRSESFSGDGIDFHRHSRYIENAEEILIAQQKAEENRRKTELNTTVSEESSISQDTSREESTVKMSSRNKNTLNIPDRKSTASNDEQGISSESEKESEMDSTISRKNVHPSMLAIEDHESAGLVLQESFDDELPYIPTTLPEERTVGVKLVPMKDRAQMEMKMCPLERPRSTTPIHPASLENYCGITTGEDGETHLVRGEKLRISLPRKCDTSTDRAPKTRSPRKTSISSGKNWFEFAEQGIGSTSQAQPSINSSNGDQTTVTEEEPPPPLPPRKSQQWIDFESIPEKRKTPKRITTVPQREASIETNQVGGVMYNYVKPEECQCECHESEREGGSQLTTTDQDDEEQEDQQPLLQQDLSEELRSCRDEDSHQAL